MSEVTSKGDRWSIRSGDVGVSFDAKRLSFDMRLGGGGTWHMTKDDSHDLAIRTAEGEKWVSLTSAGHIEAREYRSGELHGVRVQIGAPGGADASLAVIVAIDVVSEEVVTRVIPVDGPTGALGEVHYPRAFELEAGPGDFVGHVMPGIQGFLLPPDWPEEIDWDSKGQTWTRSTYMPWWGAARPGGGYMGIIETPHDSAMEISHPAGGPTHVCPKWYTSMGSLRYPRQVRYKLFGSCDHNDMTAHYRKYSISIGRLKTLEAKATEVTHVEKLRGATIGAGMTMMNIQPDSHYYDPEHPEKNRRVKPFAETVKGLHYFAKVYPSDRVIFHLDGWGKRGYDNLHPDVLPPCPDAGGWEGFKAVGDACAEHGWLFATHDNYIDFYEDAETYDDDLAVQSLPDGTIPKKAWWWGGAQSFLCAKNALGYVRRNYDSILDHGVKLNATYIDVFAIMELFECYHPDHPSSREEDMKARAACFEYVRSRGIAVSSEEPVDWAVPYIEFCYWAPIAHGSEAVGKKPVGLSLPLYNQVYHDCVVTPWSYMGDAGSTADEMALHALSYGGVPLVNGPDRTTDFPKGQLERAKLIADVHLSNGFAAMDRHDVLEPDGSRRLTTFADGSEVEVDLRSARYRLKGIKGLSDGWQDLPAIK